MRGDPRRSSEPTQEIGVLAEQLAPYLRRLRCRYSLSEEDAEDALQQSLLAFTRHRESVENPLRWLCAVLRNECLAVLRPFGPRTASFDEVGEGQLPNLSSLSAERLVDRIALQRVLGQLSRRNQRVLWMRFVAGMSWLEIADNLACGLSGAKKAVGRAVSAARQSESRFSQRSR
jgi:DNA-directed RNA polymerase specialized sigma24 family protein